MGWGLGVGWGEGSLLFYNEEHKKLARELMYTVATLVSRMHGVKDVVKMAVSKPCFFLFWRF